MKPFIYILVASLFVASVPLCCFCSSLLLLYPQGPAVNHLKATPSPTLATEVLDARI